MKATKAFLRQLEKLDMIIENKLIERDQWKSIALSVTSGSETVKINGVWHNTEKVQSSGNPQKMADAIARYVDIEAEINQYIDRLIDAKKAVINVIEQLNPTEYDLLHKVYVQHITLYEVSDLLDKSYSWVTTVHGRALKNVKRILDERRKEAED